MTMENCLNMATIEELRAILGDGFAELVEEYLKDSPRQIRQLRRAAEEGDMAQLVRAAHTLKGSSGNIGVQAVYLAAEEIERLARAGAPVEASAEVDALLTTLQHSHQALKSLLSSHSE
jgi:HPt (histidine-containing phosphotransfer) domain-containing protein